jgi:hypothetical protein
MTTTAYAGSGDPSSQWLDNLADYVTTRPGSLRDRRR